MLQALSAPCIAIQGADKAWSMNYGLPVAPVILGVITAIGGGLIRDVLAGRKTLIMSHELYAIPVTFGCCAYVLILNFLPRKKIQNQDVSTATKSYRNSVELMRHDERFSSSQNIPYQSTTNSSNDT